VADDDDFEAAGREYLADLTAMEDAAGCDRVRAATILARLAAGRNGVRLIITKDRWDQLDRQADSARALAALSAPLNGERSACVLCGAYPPDEADDPDDVETEEGAGWHTATCPWRMAREAENRG
jgi:hypothetical protein